MAARADIPGRGKLQLEMSEKDQARFWAKVALPNEQGCMLWLGGTAVGYGRFYLAGKMRGAHRLSYTLAYGPIPDGLVLDHLCRTPACVRPDHLEAVTNSENLRRGDTSANNGNIRKTHCPQGHAYDKGNTYVQTGRRHCRECRRAHDRAHPRRRAGVA